MKYKTLLESNYQIVFNPTESVGDSTVPIFCLNWNKENYKTEIGNILNNKGNKSKSVEKPALIALYSDGHEEIVDIAKVIVCILIENKSVPAQVAICEPITSSDSSANVYVVKTVIKSDAEKSPYDSIRRQAYYIPDITEKEVSRFEEEFCSDKKLSGLQKSRKMQKNNDIDFFPFELFIPDTLANTKCKETMFSVYLNLLINREVSSRDYACRISKIHVSFVHGIHSDTFYDLAPVLHNSGMLDRLALLIARSIFEKYGRQNLSGLLLVGYEKQTRLLILKIQKILNSVKTKRQKDVPYAMYLHDDENDYISFAPKSQNVKAECAVFVMPWSITLTWLCDMVSLLNKTLSNKEAISIDDGWLGKSMSICILLEGTGKVGNNVYWEKSESKSYIPIKCIDAKSEDIERIDICYLLDTNHGDLDNKQPVITDWCELARCVSEADPDQITEEERIKLKTLLNLPPVYPDKTNLYLETVVKESGPNTYNHPVDIVNDKSKEERLQALLGCVTYSHINRNNEHFRYYIDYRKYVRNSEESILTWLKEIGPKYSGSNDSSYNIVLSPLSNKNSRFLNAVVEKVFDGNCRLIQIPFDEMDDESIISRYSYIVQELEHIATAQQQNNVKLYYVYNAVNSRKHISRGLEIYRVLCQRVRGYINIEKNKYDAVFLLHSNAISSFMGNYVTEPKENVHVYLKLSIPVGNNAFGNCITCNQLDTYEYLRKSASSSRLMKEYNRLSEKYKPRTDREYDSFIDVLHDKTHSYFSWLKKWVYRAEQMPGIETLNLLGAEIKLEHFRDVYKIIASRFDEERQLVKQLTRKDTSFALRYDAISVLQKNIEEHAICDFDSNGKMFELGTYGYPNLESFKNGSKRSKCRFILKKLVDLRNYLRLRCLNDAYDAVIDCNQHSVATDKLLSEITLKCRQLDEEYGSRIGNSILHEIKIDIIIGYIKVISRPPFTNQYHLYHAAFDILRSMLSLCAGTSDSLSKSKGFSYLLTLLSEKRYKYSAAQYRLYNCLAQRLADMQDIKLVSEKFLPKIITKYYRHLLTCFGNMADAATDDYAFWNELPTKEKVMFDIVRATKWLSTAYPSKDYCIIVEENLKNRSKKQSDTMTELYASLFLENTGLLYSTLEWHRTRCIESGSSSGSLETAISAATSRPSSRYHWLHLFAEAADEAADEAAGEALKNKIETIYKLFDLLCKLDEGVIVGGGTQPDGVIKDWQYPYEYEEVCNTLKTIADADDCFIVYSKNTESKLCSRSSFRVINNSIEAGINLDEINRCISEKKMITDSVYYSEGPNNTAVILLEIQLNEGWNKDGSIYIVMSVDELRNRKQYKDDKEGNFSRLITARNILCLRNRLYKVLQRDVSVLMRFPNEYWYVKKYSDASETKTTGILHISDLHLSYKNEKQVLNLLEVWGKRIKDKELNKRVDILAITGDAVHCGCSAYELETRYELAEKIIKSIAVMLWGDESTGLISHDWQKRIIIIPGNHDYASMNELASQLGTRATEVGVPAKDEGSAMAKFSYYLNFIRKLLNVNIGELIDNNLYEVRTYRQLNMRVYSINTSAKANMLRTNRFSADSNLMKKIMLPEVDGIRHHIVLMHHPVEDDVYNGSKKLKKVPIEEQYSEYDNQDGSLNYIIAAHAPINRVYNAIHSFIQKCAIGNLTEEEKKDEFKKMHECRITPDYSKIYKGTFTEKLIKRIESIGENGFWADSWLNETMLSIYKDCEAGRHDTNSLRKETAEIVKAIHAGGDNRRVKILAGHMHDWYEYTKAFFVDTTEMAVEDERKTAVCPLEVASQFVPTQTQIPTEKGAETEYLHKINFALMELSQNDKEESDCLWEYKWAYSSEKKDGLDASETTVFSSKKHYETCSNYKYWKRIRE